MAETAWRWPVLLFLVLLLAHLFMPPSLRQYDPIDRLYKRFNPAYHTVGARIPGGSRPPHPHHRSHRPEASSLSGRGRPTR